MRRPGPPGLIPSPRQGGGEYRVFRAANSSLAPVRGYFEPPPPGLPTPAALGLRRGARRRPPPTLGLVAGLEERGSG